MPETKLKVGPEYSKIGLSLPASQASTAYLFGSKKGIMIFGFTLHFQGVVVSPMQQKL